MVDFEKMLAEKKAERAAQGIVELPSEPAPRQVEIKAIRTDCFTGRSREVTIGAYAKASTSPHMNGEVYLHLDGGPTGYESMPAHALDHAIEGGGWTACMGTDRRWDQLKVSAEELARVKKELNL
jgi:hypothetical protein